MTKRKQEPVRHEPDLRHPIISVDAIVQRDAIHVAITPLIAGRDLYRGQPFKLQFGTSDVALPADYSKPPETLGVVNPFYDTESAYYIKKGERFWGLLYPGTVTGMRHHWAHPAFDNPPTTKNEHELWLRKFCDEWNFNFNELIEAGTSKNSDHDAGDFDDGGRYVVANGHDLHSAAELGSDLTLFWEHLEGYTGKKFDEDHREGMGWSCSC